MPLKTHQIRLSLLREDEKILHNCSSHWSIHLRLPLLYLLFLGIPFVAFYFLQSSGLVTAIESIKTLWFLFSIYGLILTVGFFLRNLNFELGGCVITDQRVLRFGFKGISQMVEREILPQKIEDVKIVKKGIRCLFFDAADVLLHTSTGEVEVLKQVMESGKIKKIFSDMFAGTSKKVESVNKDQNSAWIDDALGKSEVSSFDESLHREETVGQIGEVLRNKNNSSQS